MPSKLFHELKMVYRVFGWYLGYQKPQTLRYVTVYSAIKQYIFNHLKERNISDKIKAINYLTVPLKTF